MLAELFKIMTGRGDEPRLYFWITSNGVEVDIVVETNGKLIPIEVKSSATPSARMSAGIRTFQEDFGKAPMDGYVVHPGDVRLPLGPRVTALPFDML